MDGIASLFDLRDQDLHAAAGHALGRLYHGTQPGHQIGAHLQAVKAHDGHIFRHPQALLMQCPDGTHGHHIGGSEQRGKLPSLIQKIPGTQLYAILNKNAQPQSMEMFSTGMIRSIIASCSKLVDYVVVDTPPMQLVADAEELAALVDVTVVCVRQHMVEARDINDAIDILNGDKGKVMGVVFNDVTLAGSSISSIGYNYGYGYGYGYGGHYGK